MIPQFIWRYKQCVALRRRYSRVLLYLIHQSAFSVAICLVTAFPQTAKISLSLSFSLSLSIYIYIYRRSQQPRGLRRRSAAARLLRSWVRIPPGARMFVCCERCVLSGRGLCDELITRPEESYRLWCVVVCDLENLKNEEAMTRVGSQRHRKRKKKIYIYIYIYTHTYVYITHLTIPGTYTINTACCEPWLSILFNFQLLSRCHFTLTFLQVWHILVSLGFLPTAFFHSS